MARRRIAHSFLYLFLAAGLALFIGFIAAPAITRSLAIVHEGVLTKIHAVQARGQAIWREIQARQAIRQYELQQRQPMSRNQVQQTAEQQLLKDTAWKRFYIPSEACKHPDAEDRFENCVLREAQFRKEFDRRWAAGKFAQPKS